MPFETVTRKTIEYLAIPSVVGHEQLFIGHLKTDFENLGLIVHEHDGILEISGNKPRSTIISAHADRHGLISIGEGKYAYAAKYVCEQKYGEENQTCHNTLKAISERFEGEAVYAYSPKTGDRLGEGIIESCDSCIADGDSIFYIQDMAPMRQDIPIGYSRSAEEENGYLKGQIDNVVSLGMIYVLFQNGFQGTALISIEEEIGKSWIHIKSWLEQENIETQNLIILDTSPYREKDPVEQNKVVLRNRDKSATFNPELTKHIKEKCEELYLPYQVKDEFFLSMGLKTEDLGSTELGRLIQNSQGKWSGATVQIPTTEYHTSYETTSRGCIESYYALLHNILVIDPITI